MCARWFHARAHSNAAAIAATGAWGGLPGVVLLEWPQLLGIGHELFATSIAGTLPLAVAAAALAARIPLTAVSYATGAYSCLLEISIAYVASHALLGLAREPDLYSILKRIHASHTSS